MRGEVPEGWVDLDVGVSRRVARALTQVSHRVGARALGFVRHQTDRNPVRCAAVWAIHATYTVFLQRGWPEDGVGARRESAALTTLLLWLAEGPENRRDRILTLARLGGDDAVLAYINALDALTP